MYSRGNLESELTELGLGWMGSQGRGAEAVFIRCLHAPGNISPQLTISFTFQVPVHPPCSVIPRPGAPACLDSFKEHFKVHSGIDAVMAFSNNNAMYKQFFGEPKQS